MSLERMDEFELGLDYGGSLWLPRGCAWLFAQKNLGIRCYAQNIPKPKPMTR